LDGWSSEGRHLAALCISVPAEQFFANAYENWREDTAANSSVAVNTCLDEEDLVAALAAQGMHNENMGSDELSDADAEEPEQVIDPNKVDWDD
jgi:hypothetical protein